MKTPLAALFVTPLFVTALVSAILGSPPSLWAAPLSPEAAAESFRAAQQRVSAGTSAAALRVESETSYSLRFSERPGTRELLTRSLDPASLARSPRPPFWWPEARVQWGEYLWDGRVQAWDGEGTASLLDPARYRLARTEEVEARGRAALRLVFEGVEGRDRVTVVVHRATFDPFTVEQTLLRPVSADGARLTDYRLTLSVASRAGYWLVAQGEESYRFTTSEGERHVTHTWKPLSWSRRPEPTRLVRSDSEPGR